MRADDVATDDGGSENDRDRFCSPRPASIALVTKHPSLASFVHPEVLSGGADGMISGKQTKHEELA